MNRARALPLLFLVTSFLGGLSGCAPPDGDMVDVEQGNLTIVRAEAIDRPAAATTTRVINGAKQVWVFACGADHVMRRNVQTFLGNPGSWTRVPNGLPCASPPTVGKWIGGTPREVVGLYYRSTSNHLIEAWYDSDGSSPVTDLSNHLGIGEIAGVPAVVDAVDVPGMSRRISVAVIKKATREMFTLDYYQNAWHDLRPITLADGKTAIAVGEDFGVSYGQFKKNYLSMRLAQNVYAVFTRSSWSNGYAFYWSLGDANLKGVMTFGILHGGCVNNANCAPEPACKDYGCALYIVRHPEIPDSGLGYFELNPTKNRFGESRRAISSPYSAPTGGDDSVLYVSDIRVSTPKLMYWQASTWGTTPEVLEARSAASVLDSGDFDPHRMGAAFAYSHPNQTAIGLAYVWGPPNPTSADASGMDLAYPGDVLVD